MKADVVFLPATLRPEHLKDRTVVVFDVLRATTTMTAALAADVAEIRIFPDLASAMLSAGKLGTERLLCGERNCLRPEGFDLGNSPGQFDASHAGRTVLMATTNGTKAIVAARGAYRIFVGALVNARAVARAVTEHYADCTLLCAGTNGEIAMEDVLGAGAVLAFLRDIELASDSARIAYRLFEATRGDLRWALADSQGGRNVASAGLSDDIGFAANLNSIDLVGEVRPGDPLRVVVSGR